jgi:hypothetical protein
VSVCMCVIVESTVHEHGMTCRKKGEVTHTKSGPGRVHAIFEPRLLEETLDVGDLGRDGGGRCPDLCRVHQYISINNQLVVPNHGSWSITRIPLGYVIIQPYQKIIFPLTGIRHKSAVQCAGVGMDSTGLFKLMVVRIVNSSYEGADDDGGFSGN